MANKVRIEILKDKDSAEIVKLYKKLYKGDEKQDFFRSTADPSYFN